MPTNTALLLLGSNDDPVDPFDVCCCLDGQGLGLGEHPLWGVDEVLDILMELFAA